MTIHDASAEGSYPDAGEAVDFPLVFPPHLRYSGDMETNNPYVLLGIGILGVIFLGGVSAYMLSKKQASEGPVPVPESAGLPALPPVIAPRPYVAEDGVVELPIRHTFENGAHTFSGAFDKPGACFESESSGSYESGTIQLAFSMIEPEMPCMQELVVEEFSIRIVAPEEAPVTATFNGAELRLVSEEA
jgi:hypothetical protein